MDDQPISDNAAPSQPKKHLKYPIILAVVGAVLLAGLFAWLLFGRQEALAPDTPNLAEDLPVTLIEPTLVTEEVAGGFSNIWDVVFVDANTILFDERSGKLHGLKLDDGRSWEIGTLPNVLASGEGGLLGLAVDNEFAANRTVYACYNAAGSARSVRVARFTLNQDFTAASGFTDIVTDVQSQAGRHSGCRMVMDKQNVLWIGTGDSALRTAPQDPKSLAGKVLRVDRNGKAARGNLGAPFDERVFSYGHRNIQGLVLFDNPAENGAFGYTSEHGPGVEDEINWLLPGNFGWDPAGSKSGYDESVPMTDTTKYPEAVSAIWNSGSSTIAVSGMAILKNESWSAWKNRAVVAVLKDQHIRLIEFDASGKVLSEKALYQEQFGRIRTATEAPDGNLYITTDNGGGKDKIIRIKPVTTF